MSVILWRLSRDPYTGGKHAPCKGNTNSTTCPFHQSKIKQAMSERRLFLAGGAGLPPVGHVCANGVLPPSPDGSSRSQHRHPPGLTSLCISHLSPPSAAATPPLLPSQSHSHTTFYYCSDNNTISKGG